MSEETTPNVEAPEIPAPETSAPESTPKAERIFHNATQIRNYLNELGYRTNHYRVTKAVERNELVPRRGGGWSLRTVDTWALKFLSRKVDASPAASVPAAPLAEAATGNVSEQKAMASTKNLLLDAERKAFEFAREKGRYTLTETIEAELGARARAFRLGLERYGIEQAEHVAADFGGSARTARELVRRLGIEGEDAARAQVIVQDYVLSRAQVFAARWRDKIEDLLDPYATGHWWTDAMREAWEAYCEHTDG